MHRRCLWIYEAVAKGNIPDELEIKKIEIENIRLSELLLRVEFASTKGKAKRMIQEKEIHIIVGDVFYVVHLEKKHILQFGKNKLIKVIRK